MIDFQNIKPSELIFPVPRLKFRNHPASHLEIYKQENLMTVKNPTK